MPKPKDGDTLKSYCGVCKHETTWVYRFDGFSYYWTCLGCGKAR